MTKFEKERVRRARYDGMSYTEIASELGVSINTIKSFCRRECLQSGHAEDATVCKNCGKPLKNKPKSKPKKFCSDKCRLAWWNENREMLNKQALYTIRCIACGETFESYGNKDRLYCSHACYIKDRFGEARYCHDTRAV